jgi:tRNA-dihydrouridine synthase B
MHQINDIAFRELCRKNGCGLVYTELTNPLNRMKMDFSDKPAIQIVTSSEKGVSEFVKNHDKNSLLFDLNLGCPVPKAKAGGYGYYLQKNPKMVERILKVMRKSTKKPITIKIRKGPNAQKMISIANKHCDAIAIHPRTAEQGYAGDADLGWAVEMKKKCKIPVIYSGNVDEKNAFDILKKFDFVMIGRNAIGNPGVFAKLSGKKPSNDFSDYLRIAKKRKIDFSQLKFQAMNFTKGRDNAKARRQKIPTAKDIKGLQDAFL